MPIPQLQQAREAGPGVTPTTSAWPPTLTAHWEVTIGPLTPTFGFYVTNNSGSTINNLQIAYTGKTWRVGAASRSDRLDFQYSTNATSLTTGTWTDVDALDLANPGQATGNGTVQHSASISSTISSLSIANGATVYIRWNDFNAASSDDGMGVDDFSLIGTGTPATPSIFSIIPGFATAGGAGFDLTVNGSDFINGTSTVRWNGSNRATTFVSAAQLTATILASDIATAGSATVTVLNTGNPTPSNGVTFTSTRTADLTAWVYPAARPCPAPRAMTMMLAPSTTCTPAPHRAAVAWAPSRIRIRTAPAMRTMAARTIR